MRGSDLKFGCNYTATEGTELNLYLFFCLGLTMAYVLHYRYLVPVHTPVNIHTYYR